MKVSMDREPGSEAERSEGIGLLTPGWGAM
jgi:hypothetical protein